MYSIYIAQDPLKTLVDLLRKALQKNTKVLVLFSDEQTLAAISEKIWRLRTFIPHTSLIDEFIHMQHIFFTTSVEQNPINASIQVGYQCEPAKTDGVIVTDHNQQEYEGKKYLEKKGKWELLE